MVILLIAAAAVFAFFLCRASAQKKRLEERLLRPPQKLCSNRARETAITRFIRTFDYSDWCGTEKKDVIYVRGKNGRPDKLLVCFDDDGPTYHISKMI